MNSRNEGRACLEKDHACTIGSQGFPLERKKGGESREVEILSNEGKISAACETARAYCELSYSVSSKNQEIYGLIQGSIPKEDATRTFQEGMLEA